MARTAYPTFLSGDAFTASQANTYWRDNDLQYFPYTTAGDMQYAATSSTTTRVAIGTEYKLWQSNGTVPVWGGLQYAVVYHNTTQNIGTGSATALSFNAEHTDPQGWHSTSSNTSRLTIGATGYYIFSTSFGYGGAGGSGTYHDTIEFRLNNVVIFTHREWVEVNAFSKTYTITTPIVPITAAQYMEVFLEQNSGGTRTVASAPYFSVLRVS